MIHSPERSRSSVLKPNPSKKPKRESSGNRKIGISNSNF